MSENIFWHKGKFDRTARSKLLGFQNKVLWFTGFSGSGKSTIAFALEKAFYKRKIASYVLDGDNIRHGLNKNLGFSGEDRKENIRRVSEVTRLFYDSGLMTMVSFISPYKKDRDAARALIGEDFIEVFVDCPLEECIKRDTKGLYAKAKRGEISDMTGISSAYEASEAPEITVDTSKHDVEECVKIILDYLQMK